MDTGHTSVRFAVARSTGLLTGGLGLLVAGFLVRETAGQRHVELLIEGGESGWSAVAWVGAAIAVVGLVTVLLGIGQLSGNVDYLAAREAERHRTEAPHAEA